MGLIAIGGGVGLTLFGVRLLRKGLDRLFGGAMVKWLARVARNPVQGFAAGIAFGAIAPSSTGLALLGAQLMEQRRGGLTARSMLAVLLGANVGLTVTVQLLAFELDAYAGLLILTGVLGYQFCEREIWRGLGQCALALGLIFLAMAMIRHGAAQVAGANWVLDASRDLGDERWMVVAGSSVLAVMLQSSTATIALGLGLAASGLLTADHLFPWVVGTNIGLGFTSLIAGWRQNEGRVLGVVTILARLVVACPVLALPWWTQAGFSALPGSVAQQTAMGHTFFNLAVGLVALPLAGPLHWLATTIVALTRTRELAVRETFLDPQALDTPSIALAAATRETLRMADQVRLMLEHSAQASRRNDAELARRIQKADDAVDGMNHEIKDYLSRIGENRNPADTHWQFTLLGFSNELEAVGDLVEKHLCDALLKQRSEGVQLTAADQAALEQAYARVLHSLDLTIGLLTARGKSDARLLLDEKHAYNDWCRGLQHRHYERLARASPEVLASSTYFLDSLNALRRINSHLSTIGYSFSPVVNQAGEDRGG